jgi:peroxiredoxin
VNQGLSQADLSAEAVLSQLKDLLSDPEAGAETFVPTREAASWLLQYGQIKTATRALRNIGQHFQKHPNPDVAREAKTLIDESYKLDLTQLARQVADDQSGATQELLIEIEELLSADPKDADALGFALQTAQLLEFSGHFDDALNIYRGIGRIYQKSSASGLARDVQRSVALAERRLSLVGQSLDIEGTRINGGSFDWSKYRGQWVIVGFWTTWHPGWLDELNNIRSAVSTYPDAEIEVIEICLDDDRNLVERFLKEHPTSWPVLVNSDATALGFENPNAVACGVEAVPFVLLIDPNGKVADIHLMGDRLSTALAAKLDK